MSKFDDLLKPETRFEKDSHVRRSAVGSVQSSLYQRFRKSFGMRSGAVAWMLVRATQATHVDHDDALATLRKFPPDKLSTLLEGVYVTKRKARDAACAELCSEMGRVLGEIQGEREGVEADADGVVG